mgnify:CR=1 FL=1
MSNKTQCETAAQCLKELARVMEQFNLNRLKDALASGYVLFEGIIPSGLDYPGFVEPKKWSFALFELEGKSVFVGDELYALVNLHAINAGQKVVVRNSTRVTENYLKVDGINGSEYLISMFSWNPPKPKTATISINRGEAVEVELACLMGVNDNANTSILDIHFMSGNGAHILRKALQPLVKEN